MHELREILSAYENARQRGIHDLAVATIVKTKGSTYRRPGARLLMSANGEIAGSISGGCLEGDIFQHAQKVMQSGQPVLVKYDTTSDDDLVWGLGLGCSGIVHLLVESLKEEPSYWSFIFDCVKNEKAGVVATVFRVEGELDVVVGTRMLLEGHPAPTAGGLEASVTEDARKAIETGCSITKEYRTAEGVAEVFLEVIQPPHTLYVFGAGHDSIPVVRIAKEIGWNVTVIDGRKAFATSSRFPQADHIVLSPPEDVCNNVSIDPKGAVIIMTHNYAHDLSLMKQLAAMPVRYLGVLGPRQRTEDLIKECRKDGIHISDDLMSHMYSPAGIDLGAETPEEIALAIISEIQAVFAGRSGGLLRNRKGPIHDREGN